MKIKFPGVRILDRYIMRKFIGTYVFAIMLIIIVVVIFDAAEKVDDFIENKAPLAAIAFQYYLNFIPFFINQFSGLFTFIAVIFFTSKMAYNTEIIAILSSGVSFKRLMWPYFLSALGITLLSLSLNLFVIPAANARRLSFEAKYFDRMKNVKYDQHIYRQLTPGSFVYIRDFTDEDHTATFFSIKHYQNGVMTESLDAGNVHFDPETQRWTAKEYVVRHFNGEQEIFEQKTMLDTMINLDINELGKVEELVKTMNVFELSDFIDQQREKGSDMISVFEVEKHGRFAFPAATFILTLIGVSLSARKVRGGTGLHIGIGIGLCFSYILVSKFAEEFAKGGVLPAAVSVWLPNLLYLLIALYLYRKAPK